MSDQDDVGREIDRLYSLSLEEFTPARNEAAKRLKLSGDAGGAARIKALAKPSVSAWVVNQLHHSAADGLERLYEAGDRLRAAQTGVGDRQVHQEAMQARREAVSGLVERAAALLQEAGAARTEATRRRVIRTLEALAAYPRAALPNPGPGRLVADLEAPGFEILAGLALRSPAAGSSDRTAKSPTGTARPPAVTSSNRRPSKRQRLAAEAVVQRAREELAEARAEARRARTSTQRAERGSAKAAAEAEEAENQARTRRQRADDLASRARSLAEESQRADQVVADAEQALETANDRLARLTSV